VVKLAMPPASPGVLEGHTGARAVDRIRFFATGDGALQWALDVSAWGGPPIEVDRAEAWRSARTKGPLLPWKQAVVGVSGHRTGVTLSLSLSETPDQRPAHDPPDPEVAQGGQQE